VKTSASLDKDHLLSVNHDRLDEAEITLFGLASCSLNGLNVSRCDLLNGRSTVNAVAEVSTSPEIAFGTARFGQTDALVRGTARTGVPSSIHT
jgi:hypothetical protein